MELESVADPRLEDATELRALAAQATRAHVRSMLSDMAGRLEREAAAASATVQGAKPAVQPAPPSPTPAQVASAPAAPAAISYAEPTYGFSSEGEFVEVLVLDLPGVGALPRDQITCDFTKSSIDLKVLGLAGKNYRIYVPALDKEIKPELSKLVVGKSRVTLKLKKKETWDYWTQLAAKKAPKPAAAVGADKAAAEDPMGGLMDMMKDMYDSGDDATRKMIAEAMIKSRETQAKGGPGAAGKMGGLGGGLGGGGFGGADDLDF